MAKPRRVPGILGLIALGITACIAIRALCKYSGLVAFKPPTETRKGKTNILIISNARSGSSYLGQIFNHHPQVFYIYEPLITFQVTSVRNSSLYEQTALGLLRDIFNCRFKQQTEFLSFMSHMQLNRFSSHAFTSPYCKNITNAKDNRTTIYCKDLDPLITSLSCSLHSHTVVKVLAHRLPFLDVDRLQRLLARDRDNLKIIHLMRDPRAVIASMDRVGWGWETSAVKMATTNFSHFTNLVQKFCSNSIRTLRLALLAESKFPDRYKLVRYEDLVKLPLNVSQGLFDFTGIPMSDQVMNYLNSGTQSRDSGANHAYGTLRKNASLLIDAWRNQFSIEAVRMVESQCWPVLEILRYTPIHSPVLLGT